MSLFNQFYGLKDLDEFQGHDLEATFSSTISSLGDETLGFERLIL